MRICLLQTAAPLSKQEVEHLLKKGAYGALMEDDQAGDRFCEEDIDQILQRRTQVITIEAVGKGSTFAKVSNSYTAAAELSICRSYDLSLYVLCNHSVTGKLQLCGC